jgi:filamentous hemagglutinin
VDVAADSALVARIGSESAEVAAEGAINTGDVAVYISTDAADYVDYVGITNNIERRAAEQLGGKGIEINPIAGLENLSRLDARSVEQVLIEEYGGPRGGQLLNQINSIATSNPIYAQSIKRGCALLAAVGYAAPGVCG